MDTNEQSMQYARMPHTDRRDSNLDSSGSTPYQQHQGLGSALGSHLPGLGQNGSHSHSASQQTHSPLFSVQTASPASMKRKPTETVIDTQTLKRRRNTEDGDNFDDVNNQGAKHWTDEEKTSLFKYLMGSGQDDHWNQLRATKNYCLRECAAQVFQNKKTYQALKGCYERNFNLFKQIYAFELFHGQSGPLNNYGEADRLRDYERRLQAARKANCDVGNLNARTIDHWHRVGWYDLFYKRWHGDPGALRQGGRNGQGAVDDNDPDDDNTQISFTEPLIVNNMPISNSASANTNNIHPPDHTHNLAYTVNPQTLREPVPAPPPISPMVSNSGIGGGGSSSSTSHRNTVGTSSTSMPPPSVTPIVGSTSTPTTAPASTNTTTTTTLADTSNMVNLVIPQAMLQAYLQNMQTQTQAMKMKMEYLRRREEREEKESSMRREAERLKMERETAEHEAKKQSDVTQRKTDQALALLQNDKIDFKVKAAAGEYLKRLFEVA